MFTQKISMDCTKEQYEKYLKAELEKMGYGASLARWGDDVIVNNYSSENGLVGNPSRISNKFDNSRTYLGKFNANLFLALAAMTDKKEGNYGEIWISINRLVGTDYFTQGKFEPSSIDGSWRFKFRKATVSEIMAKFGEQQPTIEERLEKVERFISELPCEKVSEPKYKEPIIGEMAIFWNEDKNRAIVAEFIERTSCYFYPFKAVSLIKYANAILFESPEQYKEFINA